MRTFYGTGLLALYASLVWFNFALLPTVSLFLVGAFILTRVEIAPSRTVVTALS